MSELSDKAVEGIIIVGAVIALGVLLVLIGLTHNIAISFGFGILAFVFSIFALAVGLSQGE